MPARDHNAGFHVLDDFVCEAIHAPSVPLADPTKQGRNEGMAVVEELVFEAGKESIRSAALEDVLESEVERLARLISSSADPLGTAALFQKLLLAALAGSQKSASA